jgi:hypothetical protein
MALLRFAVAEAFAYDMTESDDEWIHTSTNKLQYQCPKIFICNKYEFILVALKMTMQPPKACSVQHL